VLLFTRAARFHDEGACGQQTCHACILALVTNGVRVVACARWRKNENAFPWEWPVVQAITIIAIIIRTSSTR